MRAGWAIAIVLALVACRDEGGKGAPRGGSSPAPGTQVVTLADAAVDAPAALDRITVTVGGERVPMTAALIKRWPVGRFQLMLRNQPGRCEELRDNLFSSNDADRMLLVNTNTRVAPDGTARTVVEDLSWDGPGDVDPGGTATIEGTAEPGAPTTVTLDFTGTRDGERIEVRGTVVAEGCGLDDDDTSGHPSAPHPSTATITVAGRTLPIVGAIHEGAIRGARAPGRIVLSTGPKDCSPWYPWAEVRLERSRGFWTLDGEWLEREQGNHVAPDPKMRGVKVTAGKPGTSADGPTVELVLAGQGRLGDYDVALAGTVEALVCADDD